MEDDKQPTTPPPSEPPVEEPPPYKPDPDLITYLERRARPEVVKSRPRREER